MTRFRCSAFSAVGLLGILLGILGCTPNTDTPIKPAKPAQGKLQGIVVPQSSAKAVLFMSHRADIKQHLQEVLAGTVKDEIWYRIDIPESYLPLSSKEVSYDLASETAINFTTRRFWPDFNSNSNGLVWATVTFANPGLQGRLTITGSTVVQKVKPNAVTPAGEFLGVALGYNYKGKLVVNGTAIQNASSNGSIGTFVSKLTDTWDHN